MVAPSGGTRPPNSGETFLRAMAKATPEERAYFAALAENIDKAKNGTGQEYLQAVQNLTALTGGADATGSNELLNNIFDANGIGGIA